MVTECFVLSDEVKGFLRSLKPEFGFNGFGEVTYYRTYSRLKPDGSQENWADTIIRVVEGGTEYSQKPLSSERTGV